MAKKADILVSRSGTSITITVRNRLASERVTIFKADSYNSGFSVFALSSDQDTFSDTAASATSTEKYKAVILDTESKEVWDTSTEVWDTSTEFFYKETRGIVSESKFTR